MQPLTTLSVTRIGSGLYSFQLERPPDENSPFAAPFVPYAQVRVADDVVRLLIDQVGAAIEAGGRRSQGGHALPFVDTGKALFDALLPSATPGVRDLRDAVRSLATPLLLSTNDPDIPWELMHDGDGFLGTKHSLGRSLRDAWDPGRSGAAIRTERERRCLLVADPTGDLPSALEEASALRRQFADRGISCECLAGDEATFEAVLNRLVGSEFSMFHYAGHVAVEEDPEEYALALAGRRTLRSSAIERLTRAPEVVFLNGCWSAQMVEGITRAFLRAGSRLVLGSLFAAPSRGASSFSQAFYSVFFEGESAGEALRSARKAGRETSNSDAAWACFVMYGDPRFSLGADPMGSMLKSSGMQRSDFTQAALADLERASQFAGARGAITASTLLAALVSGEEPLVRDRLRQRGVSPEKLQEVFRQAFAESGRSGTGREALSLSASVREVLRHASEIAGQAGRPAISSLDLVRGFVLVKTSSAWQLLRRLKIRPIDLDPDQSTRKVGRVGPLSGSDCEAQGWSVLLKAAALMESSGGSLISTGELFGALLSNDGGQLGTALANVGIPFEASQVEGAQAAAPGEKGEQIDCSENASQILTMAQAGAAAGRRLVSESDLLNAFVDAGGGNTGASLQKRGVVLRALTSGLFIAGGLLDLDRFDENSQKILETAGEFARHKEYGVVGRSHLLYGLLCLHNGVFSSRLKEQGFDSEQFADLFHATMPPGVASGANVSLRYASLSTSLIKILSASELAAKRAPLSLIAESNLIEAWVDDGGGSGASFLVRAGVRIRRLK